MDSARLPRVVPLRPYDADRAGHLLLNAFRRDPLLTYFFPDDAESLGRGPTMFATLVRYGLLAGTVLTTAGDPAGIAIWMPPGYVETEAAFAEAGFDRLPDVMGAAAHRRWSDFFVALEPYHHRAMPGPHWYLSLLGVEPDRQGHGIGAALMEAILTRATADGRPCYLETVAQQNLKFYQRRGFVVVDDAVEPVSRLRFWTLRREP
jgi:GNAT superfamily N-acetyltransferase